MALKLFVFCAVIAAVRAGIVHSGLRYETPIIASVPTAVKYEVPPTSRVEHLAPVITTSYGYSTLPLKHEVVATVPAVKIETAPVPVASRTIHVETPAITRIEHLAPAVASSYKTEVITAPKVHVSHTPAVARIDHFAPSIKAEVIHAPLLKSELLKVETPAISTVEHLAPAVSSHLRTEIISSPSVKVETSPLLSIHHTPTVARIEHVVPSVQLVPTLKSHVIAEPSLRVDVGHHQLLKHLAYGLL